MAIIVRRTTGEFVEANRACEALFGYTSEEFRNVRIEDLTHPDDMAATRDLLERLQRKPQAHARVEKRYVRKDGTMRWGRATVYALPEAGGPPLFQVAFIEDVTEQRRAEEVLRESEGMFRQLAENVHDGFWMRSVDLQTFYVSPNVEKLLGVPLETIVNGPRPNLSFIHPDDRERVRAEATAARERPVDVQYRVVRSDGSILWLRSKIFPMRDASGRIARHAGIVENVTDRKQAADTLEQVRRHSARLVNAVREPLSVLHKALAAGEESLAGSVAPTGVARGAPGDGVVETRLASLTRRQRQVMDLLVAGGSTKTIAVELGLSPRTVDVYRAQVMRKMEVGSAAELVRVVLMNRIR